MYHNHNGKRLTFQTML